MTARFLFDGGVYKRGIDDGRARIPLTPVEATAVFHDPEVPGPGSPSSIATEFNMLKWADELCNLAVGDEIFVGLVPDATFVRGLWMMSFDERSGLTMNYDLVSVKDVYAAWVAGDATGVAAWNPASLAYDFADGLGHATKDACDLAGLYGGDWTDYRNEAALKAVPFNAAFAGLGEALYMRLTITGVADGNTDTGCCNSCGEDSPPTMQVGAIFDVLCADKQRVKNFCNCETKGCSGCFGDGCPDEGTSVDGDGVGAQAASCVNGIITGSGGTAQNTGGSFIIYWDDNTVALNSNISSLITISNPLITVDEVTNGDPGQSELTLQYGAGVVAGEEYTVTFEAGVVANASGEENCQTNAYTFTIPAA